MKKIIGLFVVTLLMSLGITSYAIAGDESYKQSYNYYTPNYEPELEYEIDGNYVYFEWDKAKEEQFKYYKFVYSEDNVKPIYPDNHTMFIGTKVSQNETKMKYKRGYWRICHVYKGYYDEWEKSKYRTCSNVVYLGEREDNDYEESTDKKIDWEYLKEFKQFLQDKSDLPYSDFKEKVYSELEDDIERKIINSQTAYEAKKYINSFLIKIKNKSKYIKDTTVTDKKKEYTNTVNNTNKYKISSDLKKKSDSVIANFKRKLNNSSLSHSEKIKKINSIISKLNTIKKSKPVLSNIVGYLIGKLETLRDEYTNDFDDIEKLFDF